MSFKDSLSRVLIRSLPSLLSRKMTFFINVPSLISLSSKLCWWALSVLLASVKKVWFEWSNRDIWVLNFSFYLRSSLEQADISKTDWLPWYYLTSISVRNRLRETAIPFILAERELSVREQSTISLMVWPIGYLWTLLISSRPRMEHPRPKNLSVSMYFLKRIFVCCSWW